MLSISSIINVSPKLLVAKFSDTDQIEIRRGVRQGCILSPMLFNLYSEKIFTLALDEISAGIVINGKYDNKIRYADDTLILADNMQDLQTMVNRVCAVSTEYGLAMNIKKIKFMVISKNPPQNIQLIVDGKQVQRVQHYKNSGTIVNEQADSQQEVLARIEQPRSTFV